MKTANEILEKVIIPSLLKRTEKEIKADLLRLEWEEAVEVKDNGEDSRTDDEKAYAKHILWRG